MNKRRERYFVTTDICFDPLEKKDKNFCVVDSSRGETFKCYSDKSAAKDICYILNKIENDLDDLAKLQIGDYILDEIIEGGIRMDRYRRTILECISGESFYQRILNPDNVIK